MPITYISEIVDKMYSSYALSTEVFWLGKGLVAPELNPAEFIWTQTVEYVAGTASHDKYELQANVFAGISRTRISQSRLFSGLHGSVFDWIN